MMFLYNQVFEQSLHDQNINSLRAKQRVLLLVVLSTKEIKLIINTMPDNIYRKILQTIYGCGLRLSEVLRLRIKDIGQVPVDVTIFWRALLVGI